MKCQHCGNKRSDDEFENSSESARHANEHVSYVLSRNSRTTDCRQNTCHLTAMQITFSKQTASKRHGRKQRSRENQDNGLLDQLGKNISDDAREGLIDPVIGRDQEVKRVIETLNRRNKNNPVLIGEPGVGKTAIAEGLAVKIHEGDVPAKLMNKKVYLLDVASLVTNTGIRGQFEERMKQLIEELANAERCHFIHR